MALGRMNRGGREENPNLGTRSALQNGKIEELEMMQMFSSRKQDPPPPPTPMEKPRPVVAPDQSNRAPEPKRSGGILSRGVSIKGTVKFNNELLIDGEVEGRIQSSGLLTIGEHARIKGEIRSKAVYLRGNVEGNIFATERCELQAGCTLKGDIEAPRFVVDEHATFLGSAKVGTPK
jgi:cytoskeletal protein CcmA (bactofilin family)